MKQLKAKKIQHAPVTHGDLTKFRDDLLAENNAQQSIVDWLTLLREVAQNNGTPTGYHYAGVGDFLLQHGVWYEPRPLPRHVCMGIRRACFGNALALCRWRGYAYVEGYAIPQIEGLHFPTHHAWNLDRDGNLIDSTWEKVGRAYFGVAFPLMVAQRALLRANNTVLDNPRSRFAIFRNPHVDTCTLTMRT
jgi:hypothetical protein